MAKKSNVRKTAEEKNEQVEHLLQQLDEGVKNFTYEPERFKALLKMQSLMPNYSFRNLMLIESQMKNAKYVASFKTWKDINRNVKKGQKAIKILAPSFRIKRNEETGQEESVLTRFVTVPVFDASQTEGEPLPHEAYQLTVNGESAEGRQIFRWTKQLAEEDGCKMAFADLNGPKGRYEPGNHKIVFDQKTRGNQLAKTAVHELVHSRLHRYTSRKTTAKEMECVAEGVAFIVCSHFGLDTSDYSFEYVYGWSGDGGASLLNYGDTIQKTASTLIDEYERVASEPPHVKAVFRGVDIMESSTVRIAPAERKEHLHYYDVSYSDGNGFEPASIQKNAWANHMATIATKNPLDLGTEGLIYLDEEEGDCILQAI